MGDGNGGAIGWIREIVLDCAEPWDLAAFWAGLLGGTPVEWYPGWVTLEPPPHGQRLSFQGTGTGATETGAPRGGVHFDVLVDDLTGATSGSSPRARSSSPNTCHLGQGPAVSRSAGGSTPIPRATRSAS